MKVAARTWRQDTFFMAVPNQRGPLLLAVVALAISTIGASARADEIRLKAGKTKKKSPKTNAAVKPEAPPNPTSSIAAAPATKASPPTPATGAAASAASPAAPKAPEVPANREEIQGNVYTNYTYGFRMYKAPSWNLIEEARSALPND